MNADVVSVGTIKPALASVNDACKYLGGVSRAKFYTDLLPKLESVLLGGRRMVTVRSMDALITASTSQAA